MTRATKSLEGQKVIEGHSGEQGGKNRKNRDFFRVVKGGCPPRGPYCPHIFADVTTGQRGGVPTI